MLRRLLTGLLAITATLICSKTRAGDTNYHDYPIGGRAVGLGGAFAAIANDSSGIFYNPAGLVDSTRSSLSVSTNLYGIEVAVGDNVIESVADALIDVERVFTQLNIIPSSAGFISQFGDKDSKGRARHAYGIGAFVPSFRSVSIQTSGQLNPDTDDGFAYRRSLLDMQFHTAASYSMRVDDKFRFGVSAVFNYRQVRDVEESAIFGGDGLSEQSMPFFSTVQTNLQAFVGSLLLTFGMKANLGDRWFFGGALTTPSVDIYDTASLRVMRTGATAVDGAASFELDEPLNVKASNPVAGNLRLGIAHVFPHRATISADIVLHAPVRYKLIELQGARPGLENSLTIETDVDRKLIANLNVGAEYLITPKLSLSLGAFTNFATSPTIPGDFGEIFQRDWLEHVDGVGGTLVVGWFTEHTLTRIGGIGTVGWGADVIPQDQELRPLGAAPDFRKIEVLRLFGYIFVSSTFRY